MTDQYVDLDTTRRVTANLWFWQGLRWAPVGPVAAGAAVLASVADGELFLAVSAVGLLLAWWAYKRADAYYIRRYGVVRLKLGQHRRRERIKWFAVYPAMLASLIVDIVVRPPVFVTGPVWAAAILLYRHSTGGGRTHYFAAGALLAALAPLPVLGLVEAGDPIMVLWLALTGVLYAVCGVLDHLELARRFPSVAELDSVGVPR
jgi:hypothetical protein